MMRRRTAWLAAWLVLPLVFAIWHRGPGQDLMQDDDLAARLSAAAACAAAGDWSGAVEQYREAEKLVPADGRVDPRPIRLERAKAQLNAHQLAEAHEDLVALVAELEGDPAAPPALVDDARRALAGARYYLTWLLRVEGQPRELWQPIHWLGSGSPVSSP